MYDTKNFDDIIIRISDKTQALNTVFKGREQLFFQHQVLQELFSALYICTFNANRFEKHLNDTFENPHWQVVHKFLCGLILNKDVTELLNEAIEYGPHNVQQKKEILLQCIHKTILSEGLIKDINSIDLLYEARLTIKDSLSISFANRSLQDFNIFALFYVIRRASCISELNLQCSSLTASHVQMAYQLLSCGQAQVSCVIFVVTANVSQNQLLN